MKISDFNISGKDIPEEVADKILEYHIRPIQKASDYLGYDLACSKKSGYRPLWWEQLKGRDGSQHMFLGLGASDITTAEIRQMQIDVSKGKVKYSEYIEFATKHFAEKKQEILQVLIENTEYTRFAVYNSFIHCDYAIQDERWVFDSKWVRQYRIDSDD